MENEENCDEGRDAIEGPDIGIVEALPLALEKPPPKAFPRLLVCGGEVTHGFDVAFEAADQSMADAVFCGCGGGGEEIWEAMLLLGREGCSGLLKGEDGVNVAKAFRFASGVIARAVGLEPQPDAPVGGAEESVDVERDHAKDEDCGVVCRGLEAGLLGFAGAGLFQSPSSILFVESLPAFRPRTRASKSSSRSLVEVPFGVGTAPKEVKSLARVLVVPLVAVSSRMRWLCSLSIRVERDLMSIINF